MFICYNLPPVFIQYLSSFNVSYFPPLLQLSQSLLLHTVISSSDIVRSSTYLTVLICVKVLSYIGFLVKFYFGLLFACATAFLYRNKNKNSLSIFNGTAFLFGLPSLDRSS